MKSKKRINTWLFIFLILALGLFLIWFDNPLVGHLPVEKKKNASLMLAGFCFLILLYDDLIVRLWNLLISQSFFQRLRIVSFGDNPFKQEKAQNNDEYKEASGHLNAHLREVYGYRWARKIRIFLITGGEASVEQLVPGLTSQRWMEGDGILLLWGGDPLSEPDNIWLATIRKLHRRPLDSAIWVTDRFQTENSLSQASSVVPLPPEKMDDIARHFNTAFTSLGWRMPLYVWSLHNDRTTKMAQSAVCLLPTGTTTSVCQAQLTILADVLAEQGTQQLTLDLQCNFLLKLAHLLTSNAAIMADSMASFFSPHRKLALAGMVFSQSLTVPSQRVPHAWMRDSRWDSFLDALATLPATMRARRINLTWHRVLKISVAGLMLMWGAGMVFSFIANRSLIVEALTQAKVAVEQETSLDRRLAALSALQQMPGQLRWRQEHHVPWYYRFGLSQNDALLNALWTRYARIAIPLIRDEAAKHLTKELLALTTMAPDSPQFNQRAKTAYNQLKMYLMLTRPEQMDAAFFSQTLMEQWPIREGTSPQSWKGNGPELLRFWGRHLPEHSAWALPEDSHLVSQVRVLLVRQMGIRNGESALYEKMLGQVSQHYTPLRLEDMTGDTRPDSLFYTRHTVPGEFTRKAWEEEVQPAINDLVNNRREEVDKVLGDELHSAADPLSPDALKERLTSRYFSDFAGRWQDFFNSIRWKKAETLSDAIDQLTLMADVRQSPLVALMNTLSIQGRTGQAGEAFSDSLVKSAQHLFKEGERQAIDQHSGPKGPMDNVFAPVMALMEDKTSGADSARPGLQTYLTRVTQVRLKLQQVTNAADPQAMSQALAQTVFQGKTVDLTTTRDYGNLVAASLGQAWSGFGQAMFVQPLEQSWQQVLQPTAAGLNAQWKALIVNDWNSAFGGRYPFRNVSSEASLPLLAQYLRNDSGRIPRFLESHLGGVLHKEGSHWVANTVNAQGLTFNPQFLEAINALSQLADVAFIRGEAGLHFELRPGTAQDVMQTDLVLDGQKLTYVNQMPEWKSLIWPADTDAPGAALSWISTQTGTRLYADKPGAWGWIRLLEKADVTENPGVNSSFIVRWKTPDGLSLNYTLRTEAGEGPLALLTLRDFELPETIFMVSQNKAMEEE